MFKSSRSARSPGPVEKLHVAVRRPLEGSNSPAYIERKPYYLEPARFGEEFEYIRFPIDHKAGVWPRFWKNVGLMAIPADVFEEVQSAALAENPDLRPAVAYPSGGSGVLVKEMPGQGFAYDPYVGNTLVAGGRLSPSHLGSSFRPVLAARGHDLVHIPGVTIHPEGVRDIAGLPGRFPGEKIFI